MPSENEFLREMFGLLSGMRFALTKPRAIKGWIIGALEVLKRLGRERFEKSVRTILAKQTDFPQPIVIENFAPPPPAPPLSRTERLEQEFKDHPERFATEEEKEALRKDIKEKLGISTKTKQARRGRTARAVKKKRN